MKSVKIEFFYVEGCKRCAAARSQLRELALQTADVEVHWEEVNVAKEPERAVEVGVLTTPAVAIDGELVFKSAPKPEELRTELHVRSRH